ncbi:hypothetical protein AAVH_03699 [Aphelenchoides avenae]|nr:hypothetical protein AAVH_03699 [Aphelenchus avenae]
MRGNNSSRGSRGRGYVRKRPTAATSSSDLAPEFPDMDPLTINDQSETAKTPTAPEPEAKADQPEAATTPSIVETSDAETFTTSRAYSVGKTIETSDAEAIPVNPAHSVGTASVTISIPPSSTAVTPSPTAEGERPSPLPTPPRFDLTTLPAFPSMEEIKRRIRQLITDETQGGVTVRKVEPSMLSTFTLAAPQQTRFGFNTVDHRRFYGGPTNHCWDLVTVCDGTGEDVRHFHQSILVARIIIKVTWRRYTVIAESKELQQALDQILAMHVRCLGQMILLVYAVRLGGNHPRTAHVLYFIRDMLRTTDFDWKIPQLLNRFLKKITEGLAANVDPLPNDKDFGRAIELWLCYCHKALLHFLDHLSGWPTFTTDWLQNKEVDGKLRAAIRKILTNAPWIIQQLRDRAYLQYVLRHLRAIETNDESYGYIRISDEKKEPESDPFLNITRTSHEYVMFVDEEFFLSPISKMLKENVQLIQIDTDNRDVVLGCIRRVLPGPKTSHAIFWFGRQYFNAGNEDYCEVIAEICHFYTTRFGTVQQYVVLPPYNRPHRDIWTGQVLCLHLQKDDIVPHAQVVLHPYDVLLWYEDQLILDQQRPLPPWQNSKQNEDGGYYKIGAIESRKFNLLRQHRIDLWTWYQGNNPGQRPPAEIEDFYKRKTVRPTPQPNPAHSVGPLPTAPTRPAVTTGPTIAAPNTAGPSTSQPTANAPANVVNIFGEQALAAIIEHVSHQATIQITAILDAKLSRIEELLRERTDDQDSTTSAEDRPQDDQPEW